ncbi:hypothetical protein EW026_g110 [Hermanssonia centrifuga]|uniref:Uncharacterized protein n=1 Tax=Hermanssonia centrifuga TaxID=98765 RepID=A0A4S4KVG8_9APHY|nr:hypothetical protein EW026_g110 [Hermanssonia centrifuga]
MSSALRSVAKHTRSVSRTIAAAPTRSFHSPFAVLSSSPLTSPPAPSSEVSPLYEKQLDHSPHPQLSPSGQRTYVVSEPDPRSTPYEVPYGAYPTSAPYQNFPATEAPTIEPRASTSPNLAHPSTTRAVPQNPEGVQESSAVRFREAPGKLYEKGGSYGGLGLMDEASTKPGEGELSSRNPQPDQPDVAKKFSDLGVDNAWKARK